MAGNESLGAGTLGERSLSEGRRAASGTRLWRGSPAGGSVHCTSERSPLQTREITSIGEISKYSSLVLTDKTAPLQEQKTVILWVRHGSFLPDPCSSENEILLLQENECEHLAELYSTLNSIMHFSNVVNIHPALASTYASV